MYLRLENYKEKFSRNFNFSLYNLNGNFQIDYDYRLISNANGHLIHVRAY